MALSEKIEFKKFIWHNLLDNGEEEIRWLRDNFEFAKQDLVAVASPPLRPKIEFYGGYIFLILLFPIYNRQNGQVRATELDIFLGRDYLITVGKNDLAALRDFSQKMQGNAGFAAKQENSNPLQTLILILRELELSIFPMLDHVAWDIDNLDNQLFTGRERELINKILAIKRNIVDIRKSMQSHHSVLVDLKKNYPLYYKNLNKDEVNSRLDGLAGYATDIWEQLQNHKATIDAIQESNESLITFRLNDIMKTLTIFSVIVFPLTLLAAIFGMNTGSMPFLGAGGFWKVIAIMAAGMVLMFYYFKKHRWL